MSVAAALSRFLSTIPLTQLRKIAHRLNLEKRTAVGSLQFVPVDPTCTPSIEAGEEARDASGDCFVNLRATAGRCE